MIPYASALYFGVLLYVALPVVVLGLGGRAAARWALLATVGMLAVQYADRVALLPGLTVREIWLVAAYAAFEWGIAAAFLRRRARGRRRATFALALLLAALPLLAAKWLPLVAPAAWFGFLGISYVTFRALDVIICIEDGLITRLPPAQFLTFLLFFGTISAGPIDRYRRFATDWTRRRSRAEFLDDLDGAVHRLFIGLLYKFIVAALIKQYWLDPAAAQDGVAGTLSYMYAYSLHLFFDFAGYSAFAIAVSYLFGIHTPENFDRPFLARNIRDFWNRWHITLSWWLRDHVYMRFVMAAMKGRWFRSSAVASALGLFLAFGLMGLWHGTSLNYVLYGLYHGVLLAAHETIVRWDKRRLLWGDGPLWQLAGIVGTFHLVCFGFLLFSGRLTAPPATAAASAYEGAFEKAGCDELGGWAWRIADRDAPVAVDIWADDRRIATVRAELFRRDLAAAGKGNGAHAYIFPTPPELKDGWPHVTRVTIADTDVAVGAPRSLTCGRLGESMDGYDGIVAAASCEEIRGWAWDATQPDRVVTVQADDGGRPLGQAPADQRREGSPLVDAAWNAHAFAIAVPPAFRDGRPHSITVRIAGTTHVLRNSPQVIDCGDGDAPTAPALPASPAPQPVATSAAAKYADNRDGTIANLSTGRMWEKKIALDGTPDGANLNDADNCYPWAGRCAAGGEACRVDADCGDNGPCRATDCQSAPDQGLTALKWVEKLNATGYAGHRDWRLPSSRELSSIVNPLEEQEPAATAAFIGASCGATCRDLRDPACSCTQPGLYWAAPSAGPNPDESWMAFFYCNGNLFLDLETNRFFVRAIRGGE